MFVGKLERLRQKPIPDLATARSRRIGYRNHPIAKTSSYYEEALVDIHDLGIEGENYYNRNDNPPYYMSIPGSIAALLLRRSVAEKLASIDQELQRFGLKIHVHDAVRPIEVQKYFHDVWMFERVQLSNPGRSHKEIIEEVEKYWAAPTASDDSPAPHSTGGAMDITLCFKRNSEPIYMGSIFDDVTELAHTDYFEKGNLSSYSDIEAKSNRRLLYWIMEDGGFANNPNEWWHFSWGDQMWARLRDVDAAYFGPAKTP